MDADATEIRVLGCLIEKQRTTPDVYPLTLNSLRGACNQATNRDPVTAYEERELHDALRRLAHRGWARLTSGQGSRTVKYRHLLDQALNLAGNELSLLAVLMLRGAQTPGELKQRTERLHRFETLADLEDVLERLIDRELVVRLPRQPGQKEERYAHLLSGEVQPAAYIAGSPKDGAVPLATGTAPRSPSLETRVAQLESEVADLRAQLEDLRSALGE